MPLMAPHDRVRRLVDAAGEVARDVDLVAPLAASTGLSPEGVALALASYLETRASEEEIGALVAKARASSRVHVILAANVFTAPLRALAFACASSESVTVRPSRRDPVFTRALVARASALAITLDETADPRGVRAGEVHVYGRDETVAAVRSAAQPGVRIRGHGAGLGVALISEEADLEVAARDLADDVVVFDQRGCLSPRVVVALGHASRGERFAAALDARLRVLADAVPRGRLDDAEAREASRYVETMSFAGSAARGAAHVVGLAPSSSPLLVPPPGRHVHVVLARTLDDARTALAPLAKLIVAVGSDQAARRGALALAVDPARVRTSPLGQMQRPPFDGPVDLR